MYTCAVRPEIAALSAYVPGMSIAEIQEKYGLSKVVKMASNENPLGVSPLVKEALGLHAGTAFRYPQGGNPRLVAALARTHGVSPDQVVVGNGSDEIIDMLIRMLAVPGKHSSPASASIPSRRRSAAWKCAAIPSTRISASISTRSSPWWTMTPVWSS